MNPDPLPRTPDPAQLDLFDAPPHRPPAPEPDPGAYWDYCPNCSARLYNAGCKYRCPRCHYFLSCSDFD